MWKLSFRLFSEEHRCTVLCRSILGKQFQVLKYLFVGCGWTKFGFCSEILNHLFVCIRVDIEPMAGYMVKKDFVTFLKEAAHFFGCAKFLRVRSLTHIDRTGKYIRFVLAGRNINHPNSFISNIYRIQFTVECRRYFTDRTLNGRTLIVF